jgi:hypothetical protein
LKHGPGKEILGNGDTFVGSFFEGLYEGKGLYTWRNGSTYQGMYKRGKKSGIGKWIVKDKKDNKERYSIYTGQFQDDCKNGFGTMIWNTGGRFDG